jgi:hypothetical protein
MKFPKNKMKETEKKVTTKTVEISTGVQINSTSYQIKTNLLKHKNVALFVNSHCTLNTALKKYLCQLLNIHRGLLMLGRLKCIQLRH